MNVGGVFIKMELINIKDIKDEGTARQFAMDYQNWVSNESISYEECIEYNSYFTDLGNKFNLIEEFKENGII